MTDFRFKNLEKYKTGGTSSEMQLSIPLPKTASGKTLRECPNASCKPRIFLMGELDKVSITEDAPAIYRRKPGVNGMTCPYCGGDSEDENFISEKDMAAALKEVEWAARQDVNRMLGDMFKGLSSKNSRNSFITIEAKVNTPHDPRPRHYREDLLRNLTCDTCCQEYGVYALGMFCPNCGSRNLHVHFKREIQIVERQIAFAAQLSEDELSYRLLGNAHEDVLTAFETYLKTVFRFIAAKRKTEAVDLTQIEVGNAFQNIERAKKLFQKLNLNPFSILSEAELEKLRLNIEIRHVVGHNLGVVDQKFIEKNEGYSEGTTLPILEEEIHQFATLCEKVVSNLVAEAPDFLPDYGAPASRSGPI